ncbi:hypothetical protein KUV57_13795 [Epibacterium sp. DP7N7-1]|nr:hypothetical protein [Epibacterium sp. DP7N7-1]
MEDRIYHGSPALFDSFSIADAGRLDGASNGALGVWVTPVVSIASNFGGDGSGYLYELQSPEGLIKQVPLKWLHDRHDEAGEIEAEDGLPAAIAYYDRIRQVMLSEGYAQLWIMEKGDAPTRVLLDPERVEILSVHELGQPDPEPEPEMAF